MKLTYEQWAEAAEQHRLRSQPRVELPAPLREDTALTKWKREAEAFAAARTIAKAERVTYEQREIRRYERVLAQAQNASTIDWNAVLASFNEPTGDIRGEVVDLPRFLAPRFGPSLGWPHGVRFSPPLKTTVPK
jgi:hypothetical protein